MRTIIHMHPDKNLDYVKIDRLGSPFEGTYTLKIGESASEEVTFFLEGADTVAALISKLWMEMLKLGTELKCD